MQLFLSFTDHPEVNEIHECNVLIIPQNSNHHSHWRCAGLSFFWCLLGAESTSGIYKVSLLASLITQNSYPACLQNLFPRIYLKKEQMLVNKRVIHLFQVDLNFY